MTDLFEPVVEELWNQIGLFLEREQAARENEANPSTAHEESWVPHTPLSRQQMAQALGQDMARAWLRRRKAPGNIETLREELAAADPVWTNRMTTAYRCKKALEAMENDAFVWRATGRGADGEMGPQQDWPDAGQPVLYFFECVGSHAGYFEGKHNEMDVFAGLFGGFLSQDVTHWMPMPGLENATDSDTV